MKHLQAIALVIACSATFTAHAQSRSMNDANQHYKNQQKANEYKRQQTNNSVNRNAQQQRYNKTQPSYTPPSNSSYSYKRK